MRKSDLCGAPERRALPMRCEVRSLSVDELTLTGYASVFDEPYDIWGGPPFGFTEVVDRKAFDETLKRSPDLHLLINHEGMPLARTKSGTLQLSTDKHGLKVVANLDRGDPDVQRLERKMTRGDMDEMSFGFRTIRHEWRNDEGKVVEANAPDAVHRRLLEVSIDKGDVSVVNFGANPATSTELIRALDALADGDDRVLAEIRGYHGDLAAAQRNLARLARETSGAPKTLTAAEVHRLLAS